MFIDFENLFLLNDELKANFHIPPHNNVGTVIVFLSLTSPTSVTYPKATIVSTIYSRQNNFFKKIFIF